MIKRALKRGYGVLFSGTRYAHKMAFQELGLPEKIDDIRNHINAIKNGATIKTSEFEAITRIFTGQKMYVDTRDISLAPHIMMDGQWEPEITTIFRKHIEPDTVLFDIGANFGWFGVVAGTDINPQKGHIHFFEANPLLAPYIFKTLAVNGLMKSSTIVTKAVSDRPGTIELTLLDDFWGSSGIGLNEESLKNVAGHDIGVKEKVRVPTLTIDDYLKEKKLGAVDVIKMDIEGHEETAYKGMRKAVAKSPRLKMFIEFTDGAYKDAKKFFTNMLEDFGHLYAISNENGGTLTKVTSYAMLKKMMDDNWIMLLASKQPVGAQS